LSLNTNPVSDFKPSLKLPLHAQAAKWQGLF
jgi:hypothetical protein